MTSTRLIRIDRNGGAGTLSVQRQSSSRQPAANEVTIDVAYSGLNFADIQMRLGFYPDAPKKPFVPGYEVSGRVVEVGEGVRDFVVGDPVIAGLYFGGYASRVTVPARQLLPLPPGVSLAEGAAMPVAFFTAHLALHEMGRVRSGDRVLIECATGGVGTIAVQMALAEGAEVTGLTTSPDKRPYIEALGARALTREAFEKDPSEHGYDFILNASGGASVRPQLGRLGMTGRMVLIGLSSGVENGRWNPLKFGLAALRMPRLSALGLIDRNAGVFGLNALHILQSETWIERLTAAFRRADQSTLRPHVDRIFPADQVAAAHRYLETKQARGKILLAWPDAGRLAEYEAAAAASHG
jgi:synaptic vesicle membrane protein VAT-1